MSKKKKLSKFEEILLYGGWEPIYIDGVKTKYEANINGHIRNVETCIELSGSPDKRGYLMVTLHTPDGKSHSCLVHRLIASTFIPNPENKPTVNHKDGIKIHNNISNLEWASHQENIDHAIRNGLRDLRGTRSVSNKYTEEQVRDVCQLLQEGWKIKEVAKALNVNINLPRRILYSGKWSHISKDYNFSKFNCNRNLIESHVERYANVTGSTTIPLAQE